MSTSSSFVSSSLSSATSAAIAALRPPPPPTTEEAVASGIVSTARLDRLLSAQDNPDSRIAVFQATFNSLSEIEKVNLAFFLYSKNQTYIREEQVILIRLAESQKTLTEEEKKVANLQTQVIALARRIKALKQRQKELQRKSLAVKNRSNPPQTRNKKIQEIKHVACSSSLNA